MKISALLLLMACAHAPVEPVPEPVPEDVTLKVMIEQQKAERYLLAKMLTDACTDKPTTEDLINVVYFSLEHCPLATAACLRKACRVIATDHCPRRHVVMRGIK